MKVPFQEFKPADDELRGKPCGPSLSSQSVCDTMSPNPESVSSVSQQPRKQRILATPVFVVSIPVIAHLQFSWMGNLFFEWDFAWWPDD
jgi:hypothetical protein